ncbi:MAG: hypothetical protein R6V36_07295 [Psychroflexus sp.]
MYRILIIIGLYITVVSCSSTEFRRNSKFKIDDKSVNLYAFIGEKISVQNFEREPSESKKIMGKDGDSVVQTTIYFDQRFRAKYKVIRNVFNDLETDTIEFFAYDHYGRPAFENFENSILYLSLNKEKNQYYLQKYQFDPVKRTKSGTWKGLNGKSIEKLFKKKQNGVFAARGLFSE